MDFHLGIPGLETAQNLRQPRRGDTIITADIEDPGQDALNGRPQVGSLLRSPDDFLKDRHHLLAIGRRPDSLLVAHEQRKADFLLQRTDHTGHPRLGIPQFLAGRRQTAILNRQEQRLTFYTIHITYSPISS